MGCILNIELGNNEETVMWVMLCWGNTCFWPKLIQMFGCGWQSPRV